MSKWRTTTRQNCRWKKKAPYIFTSVLENSQSQPHFSRSYVEKSITQILLFEKKWTEKHIQTRKRAYTQKEKRVDSRPKELWKEGHEMTKCLCFRSFMVATESLRNIDQLELGLLWYNVRFKNDLRCELCRPMPSLPFTVSIDIPNTTSIISRAQSQSPVHIESCI